MFKILEKLCYLSGVSGNEEAVSEYITSQIKDFAEIEKDNQGNLIAFKKGKKTPAKKLMIAAHMDEVGFIITGITETGYLKFTTVGGIDSKVIFARRVLIGDKKILGVIGGNPIHLLKGDEREKAPKAEDLYMDIGATSKEQAEKLVPLGTYASFEPVFEYFGDNRLRAKAIDDRFGCALMIDLIKQDLDYDCYFAFCVQEEVGLRGSKTAAYKINPDFSIVIDATTAADIPGCDGEKRVCLLNEGPVVSIMDKSTIYDKELVALAFDIAKQNNIKCQTKTQIAGGNDAGSIHVSRSGVRTVAMSLPTRYIHSQNCVGSVKDIEDSKVLLEKLANAICEMV